MKIVVDKEAADIVRGMCDITLKASGLQNVGPVTKILNAMEVDEIPAEGTNEKEPPKPSHQPKG